jgi:hypothetical protein
LSDRLQGIGCLIGLQHFGLEATGEQPADGGVIGATVANIENFQRHDAFL